MKIIYDWVRALAEAKLEYSLCLSAAKPQASFLTKSSRSWSRNSWPLGLGVRGLSSSMGWPTLIRPPPNYLLRLAGHRTCKHSTDLMISH